MLWQGLFGMILGFLIIIFRPQIKRFTGNIGFAERYLGSGGTWTFLLIIGLGLFLFGLMWSTGSLQEFVGKTFGGII